MGIEKAVEELGLEYVGIDSNLNDEQCFDMDNTLACGLGGYELSVAEFEFKNENYISIMLQADNEGAKATEILYNYLTKNEPMTTSLLLGGKLATCDNYLVYFNYSRLTE